MKKTFSILGFGLVSLISANGYSGCPNGNCGYPQGQGYSQDQGQGYYQGSQGQSYQQGPQGQVYYQGQQGPQGQVYYQGQQGQQGQPRYYQSQQQPQDGYYQNSYNQSNDQNQRSNAQYQRSNDQYQRSNDQNQRPAQGNDSSQQVSDQDIDKKIHDLIDSGVFSKGYPNVTSRVNNGNVTLSGSVNSQDDKVKIEDGVRKIKGVRQLNNQITVVGKQTGYNDTESRTSSEKKYTQDSASTDTDRLLNSKIREKISDGWFSDSYDKITLKTNNGVVTITGVVDSSSDIQKINEKLKDVDGIRSVNNQLSLKAR
ncbi:MAG: BON domain-containing protein [Parachlamydiaceae bacterium]|nr:BON domain-containing protein [Parachlamydiaceae bacterium]